MCLKYSTTPLSVTISSGGLGKDRNHAITALGRSGASMKLNDPDNANPHEIHPWE
jgi:hypothetical protein